MNTVKHLTTQIFINQEESYAVPRHGEFMFEYVGDRVQCIASGVESYEEFIQRISESNDPIVLSFLIEIDRMIADYEFVKNEFEEHKWDLKFETAILYVLDKFDYDSDFPLSSFA